MLVTHRMERIFNLQYDIWGDLFPFSLVWYPSEMGGQL